jgi:hypothetical protein
LTLLASRFVAGGNADRNFAASTTSAAEAVAPATLKSFRWKEKRHKAARSKARYRLHEAFMQHVPHFAEILTELGGADVDRGANCPRIEGF